MKEQLIPGEFIIQVTTGKHNEFLHLVVWFRKRRIKAINSVMLNDIAVNDADLDSEGAVVQGLYAKKITIRKHLVQEDQLAYSLMLAEIEWWTVEPRFRGVPYIYVRLEWDEKIFSAIPRIAAWIE